MGLGVTSAASLEGLTSASALFEMTSAGRLVAVSASVANLARGMLSAGVSAVRGVAAAVFFPPSLRCSAGVLGLCSLLAVCAGDYYKAS